MCVEESRMQKKKKVFGEVQKLCLIPFFDLAHEYVLTNTEIMGPWI
jgi:hypothetical protein